jgi:hypothetical protein
MKTNKKGFIFTFFVFLSSLLFAACATSQTTLDAQAPNWVNNLEKVYPSRDWLAVIASGDSQRTAEQAAMNSLARAFRADVASLTQTTQRFTQIINEASGKSIISFDESQNFIQEVNTATNVRFLIGVQTDHYQARDGTFYVNARMNRKECAARYSGMIRENSSVINKLLAYADGLGDSFEAYSALSFAAAIAGVTDNFQNILEVLDSSAAGRRPSYGGANAIITRMREIAGRITVGITVETADRNDAALVSRAIASFFTGKGFKTAAQGSYALRATVRFEPLAYSEQLQSCRYYLNAALENKNGIAVFSFTEDDRKNHTLAPEAKRMALRAVETSVKEGKFAADFEAWLNSLIE